MECVRANIFERHATESNTIEAKSSANIMKFDRSIDIRVGRELKGTEMVIRVRTKLEYDLRNGERPTAQCLVHLTVGIIHAAVQVSLLVTR
jgi:hypothetical protein